ncbi:hypothetical protein KAFR_0I01580 [Kazachstania africana CBS 2517]|uniref:Actin-like protein ARP9 n=1 Tax=Kazachstania africana (strain ATCC 22294 / BCRC 22015 / CBS 2517 / CECT 1963 / NBRC 1671 / NRRL Y-8276) TaxID=1071382 RepID=H2AZY9_KAZAF|nr:hypothetical protein KAFR_0I01580 [Kazachstania africana CBS 2517]CCF59939.1 hypothetical protein KAFR_0I01580 [Kazachstania africana CBS 2517]
MAPFRLDSILIIYPKSQNTLVQFGLNDETFAVPEYNIPTRIFRDKISGNYYSEATETTEEINPIQQGRIKDLDAFLQYLKLIYGSILSRKSKENPHAFDGELSNIPIILVTHYSWSQSQLERITQFVFESLNVNNLLLLPSSLAASYSMVSLQNCCVIDIGKEHTDIIPIVDYTPLNHLASSIPNGGDFVTENLAKILPNLTKEQIEHLKSSEIFEVLSDDMLQKNSDLVNEALDEEDDTINVADIITSGRDTREFLEERDRKKKEKNLPNVDMETNSFWDPTTKQNISVGKERFQGCHDLISKISKRVGLILNQVDDINRVKQIWENIVILGGTSSINGFKEGLLAQLLKDHLVTEPEEERAKREQEAFDALPASKRKNKVASTYVQNVEYTQIPSIIRLAKYPEYFPEWKKQGYAEIAFLGAQVVSKQIFTHSRDAFYITREKYNEFGPSCLWNVEL